MQKKTRGDVMKSLDEVLKAYDIHHNKDKDCEHCPYNELTACIYSMNKDLYKYVILLKEENKKLIEQM